jgi:hypothetical protein
VTGMPSAWIRLGTLCRCQGGRCSGSVLSKTQRT